MTTIKALLASKKFKVALVTTLIWAAGLFGFDVSIEAMSALLSPLYLYIGAQGIADSGKEAAMIKATSEAALYVSHVAAASAANQGEIKAPTENI